MAQRSRIVTLPKTQQGLRCSSLAISRCRSVGTLPCNNQSKEIRSKLIALVTLTREVTRFSQTKNPKNSRKYHKTLITSLMLLSVEPIHQVYRPLSLLKNWSQVSASILYHMAVGVKAPILLSTLIHLTNLTDGTSMTSTSVSGVVQKIPIRDRNSCIMPRIIQLSQCCIQEAFYSKAIIKTWLFTNIKAWSNRNSTIVMTSKLGKMIIQIER